jgi:hypothetical protein
VCSSAASPACEPEPGLLAFAAVVILTMLAARSFDPRLILGGAREQWLIRLRHHHRRPARGAARGDPEPVVARKNVARLSLVWIVPLSRCCSALSCWSTR